MNDKDVKITSKPTKPAASKRGFFGQTRLFGFELFMVLFGLLATAVAIDFGLYVIFNYFRGFGTNAPAVSEFAVWVAVSMIVWLPLTVGFYLRVRSELTKRPNHQEQMLYKVARMVFLVTTILLAIGALFTALYVLTRSLITAGIGDIDFVDQLVRVVIPALLMVGIHIGLFFAMPRNDKPSRKLYAWIITVLGLVVCSVLLFVSVMTVRGTATDRRIEGDLSKIEHAITTYYSSHHALPTNIDVLEIPSDVKVRSNDYVYIRNNTYKYQLCADFSVDTLGDNSTNYGYYYYYHQKGRHCFDRTTSYYYNEPMYNYNPDTTVN